MHIRLRTPNLHSEILQERFVVRHTIINIVIDYNSISFERQDTNIEFSGCSIWQEEVKHLRVFQELLGNLNVQMNKSGWFPL